MVVFVHYRGQEYPWDGLLVIRDPSDCLALYDRSLGSIDVFYSADFIGGNRTVYYLVPLDDFF